jgi:hypothetical protein
LRPTQCVEGEHGVAVLSGKGHHGTNTVQRFGKQLTARRLVRDADCSIPLYGLHSPIIPSCREWAVRKRTVGEWVANAVNRATLSMAGDVPCGLSGLSSLRSAFLLRGASEEVHVPAHGFQVVSRALINGPANRSYLDWCYVAAFTFELMFNFERL